MSTESPAYSPAYIKAWTLLSVIVGLVLMVLFVKGQYFIEGGNVVWSLLRWISYSLGIM